MSRRIARQMVSAALALVSVSAVAADNPGGHGVSVTPIFVQKLPNAPGKTMTTVSVDYAPGGASNPHRHAVSAVVFAYVVSGAVRSQVEGAGEARVYRVGESWYEPPNAHHLVSENASMTEP